MIGGQGSSHVQLVQVDSAFRRLAIGPRLGDKLLPNVVSCALLDVIPVDVEVWTIPFGRGQHVTMGDNHVSDLTSAPNQRRYIEWLIEAVDIQFVILKPAQSNGAFNVRWGAKLDLRAHGLAIDSSPRGERFPTLQFAIVAEDDVVMTKRVSVLTLV